MCLLSYLIKCVHIWNLCKSVSQYISNDQYMIFQKHCLVKYLCEVQNGYEYNRIPKFHWYDLRFHTEVNILKTTTCGVLVKCQESYWHFSEKYIKILSTFQQYICVRSYFLHNFNKNNIPWQSECKSIYETPAVFY